MPYHLSPKEWDQQPRHCDLSGSCRGPWGLLSASSASDLNSFAAPCQSCFLILSSLSLCTLEQLNVPSVGTKHNIQGVVSRVICTKGQLIGNRYFQNSLFSLWSYGIENDGIVATVSHSLPRNFNKKCWIRPLLTILSRKTKFPLMFWKIYKLQN